MPRASKYPEMVLVVDCRNKSLAVGCGTALSAVILSLAVALTLMSGPAAGVAGYGDVTEDSYFADAVQWSVETNITDISGACFLPDEPISRGETALYIWNMERRPDAPAHSFVDLTEQPVSAAVSWLSHAGITTGTSTARFSPEKTLTRVEIAAFLHRLAGEPSASAHPFRDVVGDWQNDSVSWMSDAAITTGTAPTEFSPDKTLTRAEVITFLYRYKGSPAVAVDPETPRCDAEAERTAAGPDQAPLVAVESAAPLVLDGAFDIGLSFSKPVNGLTGSDLVVVNGRATSLVGSGSDYTATIEPSAHGTVMVRVPAAVAQSLTGLPNEASAPFVRTNAPRARPNAPGFDTWNRAVVLDAAEREFTRDEPDWGYTGDVDECVAGTTSQAFRESVIQRVNWYRQMAGLEPVTENPVLSAAARQAALMMLAEDDLSHYPTSDWACFSVEGASSAGQSNLGLGNAGVAGIDSYMQVTTTCRSGIDAGSSTPAP